MEQAVRSDLLRGRALSNRSAVIHHGPDGELKEHAVKTNHIFMSHNIDNRQLIAMKICRIQIRP